MPEEPAHKMDELLRRYAAQRRAESGAPLELSEQARRRLADEAARQHPPAGALPRTASSVSRGWADLWRLGWPRLAYAVSICAFMFLAGFVLLQTHSWKRGDSSADAGLTQSAAPAEARRILGDLPESSAPAQKEGSVELRDRIAVLESSPATRETVERRGGTASSVAPAAESLATRSAPAEATQFGREAELRTAEPASPKAMAKGAGPSRPETPPADTAKKAEANAVTQQMEVLGGADRYFFKQTGGEADSAARRYVSLSNRGELPFLNSFHLVKQGERVEVVDQDGSQYIGAITLPTTALPAGQVAAQALKASADSSALAGPPTQTPLFGFRISGTNQSTGQKLLFVGEVRDHRAQAQAPSQAPAPTVPALAGQVRTRQEAATNAPAALVIQGTALVDQTNQIPINAVSVPEN